jgi:histidyl-tRNA synthetase
MDLIIHLPNNIKLPKDVVKAFHTYLQQMANRVVVGYVRYGYPEKRKCFMSRMLEEAKAYKKKGNKEQTLNVSVYGFLESFAPEHPHFHFDNKIDSVTRGKF